jgi:uncharacterized membrane protein YhaH (DUF805 family)
MMTYLFSLRGRVDRLTYNVHLALGLSALLAVVIICLTDLIRAAHQLAQVVTLLATILAVWSQVAIVVKRLHDLGRPGAHCFLLSVPLYNLYLGIVLSCKPGTIGANEFGPDPRQTGLNDLETVLNAASRHQSRGDWHPALELYQSASRLVETQQDQGYVDHCIADLQLRIAEDRAASVEVLAAGPSPGVGLACMALVVPVVAGVASLFVTSFNVSLGIGVATVLVTSFILSVDASRLGRTDSTGRVAAGPVGLFIGMCLLWIVGFPLAFHRRSRFAKPNLTIPAVAVALCFAGGPFLYALLVPPDLPTCSSAEVVQLLDQLVRQSSRGRTVKSVDEFRELSFDRKRNERRGQCVAHTDAGDIEINYLVRWLDREMRQWEVRIRPELPSGTSPEVTQLLNQIIWKMSIGPRVKSIDGFREVRSDPNANNRQGRCVVHTDDEEIEFQYEVHRSQKDEGRFEVTAQPVNPASAPETPTRPPVPT